MQTINERIAELMKGNYDPLRPDNLAETLANLNTEQVTALSELLKIKSRLVASYIDDLSFLHWRKLAASQAECDEENEHLAACERCHGEGCSSCNDKEHDNE